MPFMVVAFRPLEFIVTPETTYIIIADYDPLRRIFTDGRDWPKEIEPTFQAIQSANGSIATVTANTTCSRSRPVGSRGRASTKSEVYPFTVTISRCSRSVFISTRTIRI
jgi:hypothetical protein